MFVHNSLLFVPGSRPDRFAKAKAAGAGLTIIDLEDAVPADGKQSARDAALAQMGQGADGWVIRINPVTTITGIRDLAALADAALLPPYIMLPMVESPVEIEIVAKALGTRRPPIIPLIETPKGLRHAHLIGAHDAVAAMMFGGGDFSSELGVALEWTPLLGARSAFMLACAEARVPAIDVPFIGMEDAAGLAEECAKARALGFAAKAAVHPSHVGPIEAAFTPSLAEVAEAEAALAAYAAADGGVARFRGKILEAPLVARYRAVLSRKGKQQDA